MVIGSFYGPPHSPDILLDDLLVSIATIKHHFQIILGGDFNCPGIDWEHGTLLDFYVSHKFQEKLRWLPFKPELGNYVLFHTQT